MDDQGVCTPKPYAGTFFWNPTTLHEKIKAFKSDYNLMDPRTWPLVTISNPSGLSGLHDVTVLPWAVAYDDYWVDHVLETTGLALYNASPRLTVTPAKLTHPWFYYYPYNFTRDGERREHIGILQQDLEFWMVSINGREWRNTVQRTVSEECTESNPETNSCIPEATTDVSFCTTTTPYDQIMKLLGRQKDSSLGRFATQEEMANLKSQLQQESERAEAAERSLKCVQDALLKEMNKTAETERCRLQIRDRMLAIEAELKENGNELRIAREEAEEANKQIEDIWKALIEMQGGSSS